MSEKLRDNVIKINDEAKTNYDMIINDWSNCLFSRQLDRSVTKRTPRIQKVPQILRMNERNNKEYDPVVVSFGPYNHGKRDLELAEEFKPTSLRIYASYCDGKTIEDLHKEVLEVIDVVRGFYVEGSTNEYKDEEFAEMMLLDGCLILNLIEWVSTLDMKQLLIIDHLGALGFSNLYRDMFLLENQLPYLVLQVLTNARFDGEYQNNKIFNILLESFDVFFSYKWQRPLCEKLNPSISQYEKQPPLHLLEILRACRLSKFGISDSFRKSCKSFGKADLKKHICSFRSVTEIKARGIFFRPCNIISSSGETDMNFKSYYLFGKLEIPPTVIDKYTKSMLLNLIAYEMCPNNPNDFRVTSYVRFMKMLVQHPGDVKELRTKNILLNVIGGDDEVVTIFKDITAPHVNVLVFDKVVEQIQRHYNSKARTWIAELITNNFSSPWTVIAFLAAVAILVLAILQTYFTINPPK